MPVAIRSLNGYYGFLDSLRSLEMTTVTDKSQFIEYSSYNIVGGGAYDAPKKPLQKAGRPGGRPLHSKVETAR